ncbi:MAG: CDP-diacylglycerol--glycerol-3-phosphate 3-phosphatidyltransferase [Pirellulales bacterium]|nr:CDP-diacylglycerol--glycerol-3-phosphate 3-phosphatidyltransferase [Pirellulales bacterium]
MTTTTQPPGTTVFNLPNQLTIARLVLSIVLFVLIAFGWYLASTITFIVAASTDWLDGYFARKYGLVTVLGRILDPIVDKVIVCGTFIFLGSIPGSGIAAWMAVVVVVRELLVTALRSFLEQQGKDFSAAMSGKLKMLVQCLAAGLSLFYLYLLQQREGPAGGIEEITSYAVLITAWTAIVLTIYSGVAYVRAAVRLMS